MFKRVLLSLTFIATLGAATLFTTNKAFAHGCGYGGYGYRTAYYPSYYGYGYGPRVVAYPGAYPVYYRGWREWDDDHHHHHHRHRHHRDSGITFTFGF